MKKTTLVLMVIVSTSPVFGAEEAVKKAETNWGLVLLGLLLVLGAVYLFYRLLWKERKEELLERPRKRKRGLRFFLEQRKIRARERKLKKMIQEREKKAKQLEREELFQLFGGEEGKKRSYLELLEKIIKAHELRKKRGGEIRGKADFQEEMERVIGRLKKEGRLTEKKARDVFEELKKIIEGKK